MSIGVGENNLAHSTTISRLSGIPHTTLTQARSPPKLGFLSAARLMHNATNAERSQCRPTILATTKSGISGDVRADLANLPAAGSSRSVSDSRKKPPKSAEFVVDSDDSDAAAIEEIAVRAPVRRRGWTPVEDDATPVRPPKNQGAEDFARLVNGFQYGDGSLVQAQSDAPEPVRIIASKRAAPRRSAGKKTTRDKSVKKGSEPVPKPRARKDLHARPPREPKTMKTKSKVQTITALAIAPYRSPEKKHSPQPTIPEALAAVVQPPPDLPEAAPKQPAKRKRRAPPSDSTKSKKPKRGTTKSVRATIKDLPRRDLLAPVHARNSLDNQVFIFGTSSQLHAEESPETLVRIQQALHESELSPRSNVSPIDKSRHYVPTAPHGTSLSAGQAFRDLWCVSARDDAGSTLLVNDPLQDEIFGVLGGTEPNGEISDEKEASALPMVATAPVDRDLPHNQDSADDHRQTILAPEDLAAQTQLDDKMHTQLGSMNEDDFIALSSDPLPTSPEPAVLAQRGPSPAHAPLWLSTQRGVLQPLDVNLSIRSPLTGKTISQQFRLSSGKTSPAEPVRMKQRGRPTKAAEGEREVVVIPSSSPVAFHETHVQGHNITSPSKILASINSSPPSEWHNVDEISDSEDAPTPSPPRRQIGTPQQDLSLDFDADEAVAAFPAAPTISKDDPQWSSVFLTLFPRITSSIKAMKRSDSLTNPNWHEKILLYDPIVIEDLTAWLNTQGLRVAVRRTKSRKMKGVLDPEQDETQEELSHWMVQKWCEENSVCCLWREGLRGGVRTRY